jgi:DMSO/TMAO reductase YedYZ molybdopterin-dependent catalytic subunit
MGTAKELIDDLDDPLIKAQIEQKRRLRDRSKLSGASASSIQHDGGHHARGQRRVNKWVKLDLGRDPPPTHDPWASGDDFGIEFKGKDDVSRIVTLGEIKSAIGGAWETMDEVDWHCVTGWSYVGLKLRGARLNKVLEVAFGSGSIPAFNCLFQVGADGYTVGVDSRDIGDSFFAVCDGDGVMLSRDHGGPRLVFPSLYGWKSAKYLKSVLLLEVYEDGFWEKMGCNRRGRWAYEERWSEASARVWNMLSFLTSLYAIVGGERIWVWVMVRGGALLGALAGLFTNLFNPLASKNVHLSDGSRLKQS